MNAIVRELSIGRVALYGFTAGCTAALGIMGVLAARTVWTVTKGHRWYQVKQL